VGATNQRSLHSQLVRSVCAYLSIKRIPFSVTDSGAHLAPDGSRRRSQATAGWPDITAVLPPCGLFLGLEIKTGKGALGTEQRRMRDAIRAAGGLYVEVRSLEDVIGAVEGVKENS